MDWRKIAQEIKDKLDIVNVIREYMPGLRQRGRNFIGLCPFHSEKNPSFTVSREKQMFYCFGCHVGGDLIKFVSEYENLTYIESLKKLASKANINIDINISDISEEEKEKILIKQINSDAMILFEKYLKTQDGKKAVKILTDKGFKPETLSSFNIGYAPDSYDSLYKELSRKYSKELLIKSGLISVHAGRIYDTFINRIIIPIRSFSGDVVGFGARAIEKGQEPKYLNSTETLVFSKRKTLFGLYNSIAQIRRTKKIILVEGYMDVMMMHQYLFNITISPLGTSTTYEQANMIKNIADEIIIMFDPDTSGVNSSIKAADIIIDVGGYPKIAKIDNELDPDEYLIKNGIDEMIRVINEAKDVIDFKIDLIKSKYKNLNINPHEKMKILEFLSPTIIKQKNDIIKNEWVKKISQELIISESAIINFLTKNARKEDIEQQIKISNNNEKNIEKNFIEMLIKKPQLIKTLENFSVEYLSSEFAKNVYETIQNNIDYENINEILLNKIPQHSKTIMSIIINDTIDEKINESVFKKAALQLEKNAIDREIKYLKSKGNNLTEKELKRLNELIIRSKNFKL